MPYPFTLCTSCAAAAMLGKRVRHLCDDKGSCGCGPCLNQHHADVRARRNAAVEAHLVATRRGIAR